MELVHAGKRLLNYLDKSGDALHPRLQEPLAQLRRILHENIEEHTDGEGKKKHLVIEKKKEKVPDKLVSPVDPDARHGYKSATKPFLGYKTQIVENEKALILDVEPLQGNNHDSFKVAPMIDRLDSAGIKPRIMVGDKAYGQEPLANKLTKRGVQMITPLTSSGVSTRSLFYQAKTIFNQSALYKRLLCLRYMIEQKNGELKNRLGFKRCRYRGLAKFHFQSLFAALSANIQRYITLSLHVSTG